MHRRRPPSLLTVVKLHAHTDMFSDVLHACRRGARYAVVEPLLKPRNQELRQQLNAQDENGNTALHWAIDRCESRVIALLLNHGAHPEMPNLNGDTPLHRVAWWGDMRSPSLLAILQTLLDRLADPERPNAQGHTPIDLMTRLDCRAALDLVRRRRGLAACMTSLVSHSPVGRRDFSIQRCLAQGLDPNGHYGITVTPWLVEVAKTPDLKTVQALLHAGARPDARDGIARTALHQAASHSLPIVQALLNAGALVDLLDHDGHTPLHVAVVNNRPWIVKQLLDAGADPLVPSQEGQSPWSLALGRARSDPLFHATDIVEKALRPAIVRQERQTLLHSLSTTSPSAPAAHRRSRL